MPSMRSALLLVMALAVLTAAACATPVVVDDTNPASPQAPEAQVPSSSVLQRAAQGPLFIPDAHAPSPHQHHNHGSHE
jgi:hypothetical protein